MPAKNIGICWFLHCILIYIRKMLVMCLVLRTIYSIRRMIIEWCKITTSIGSIRNVAFKLCQVKSSQNKCYASCGVAILEMWLRNPFLCISISSIYPNYTPVRLPQVSYSNLVMTLFQSVIYAALNVFISIWYCPKYCDLIYLILRISYLSFIRHFNFKRDGKKVMQEK